VVVRDARLDDPADPKAIVGHEADGSPIEVPLEKVAAGKRREIVESLKEREAPAPEKPAGTDAKDR
jgi:hypothetical protein